MKKLFVEDFSHPGPGRVSGYIRAWTEEKKRDLRNIQLIHTVYQISLLLVLKI